MKTGKFAILLVAMAASACGDGHGNGSTPGTPPRLVWKPLPDGSKIATLATDVEDTTPPYHQESLYRCWPKAGLQDCLVAMESSISGLNMSRYLGRLLPTGDETSEAGGYSCSRSKDFVVQEESIYGLGGKLISNPIRSSLSSRPWTASFVAAYMRQNGVSGTPHFACSELLILYRDGSLATFGTSSVSYNRHMK